MDLGVCLKICFDKVDSRHNSYFDLFQLENEKFFELKIKEYRDGIKRKETREGWGMSYGT